MSHHKKQHDKHKHHDKHGDKHHHKHSDKTQHKPNLGKTREQLIALRHELEKVQQEMHTFFDQSVDTIRHQQSRLNARLQASTEKLPTKK